MGPAYQPSLRAVLRAASDGWDDVLNPVVARYPGQGLTHLFWIGRSLQCRGLGVSGSRADQIRDPATGQPGSAKQDRLSAHAPSRTTSAPCAPVPWPISAMGRNLDQAAEGLSPRFSGIPENFIPASASSRQHEPPATARRCFYNKSVGRPNPINPERRRSNWTRLSYVPNVRRQRGAAPASCARLQPRQFPAHAGDAGADQGLVALTRKDKLIKIGPMDRYVNFQMAKGAPVQGKCSKRFCGSSQEAAATARAQALA